MLMDVDERFVEYDDFWMQGGKGEGGGVEGVVEIIWLEIINIYIYKRYKCKKKRGAKKEK